MAEEAGQAAQNGDNVSQETKDAAAEAAAAAGGDSGSGAGGAAAEHKVDEDAIFAAQWEKRYGEPYNPEKEAAVKEVLSKKPEPTEHEKETMAVDREYKLTQKYIQTGKTAEEFKGLMQIAKGNEEEIGLAQYKVKLAAAGFSEDEVAIAIRDLKFESANLDEIEDEGKKAHLKKLNAFASVEIENEGKRIKAQAEQYIASLESQLQEEAELEELNKLYPTMVDGVIQSLPKEIALGKIKFPDGEEVDVPSYTSSEQELKELRELIATPQKLKSLYLNEDGSINAAGIAPLLQKALAFESIATRMFLQGADSQVKKADSVFGGKNPGAGGSSSTMAIDGGGNIVSKGNPIPYVRPQ
jgi:hypothetical protein